MEIGKDVRLQVVGINYKDKPKNALKFLDELGNPYAAVGVDQKGRSTIDWGVYGIPETFLIGTNGTVLYKHIGPLSGVSFNKMKSEIESAIPKQ